MTLSAAIRPLVCSSVCFSGCSSIRQPGLTAWLCVFFHVTMYHIWSNNADTNTIRAFRSLVGVRLPDWEWTENAEAANLWCLDLSAEKNMEQLTARYYACSQPAPKVIFLSHEFAAAPIPEWVYFRSPVNTGVLIAWLRANGFSTETSGHSDNAGTSTAGSRGSQWKNRPFRLKMWPNTTDYSDDTAVVFACGAMLRDWHTHETALQLGMDETMLNRILDDAEKAGNMAFRQNASEDRDNTHEQPPDTAVAAPAEKNRPAGMWGKLKGLIGIS